MDLDLKEKIDEDDKIKNDKVIKFVFSFIFK